MLQPIPQPVLQPMQGAFDFYRDAVERPKRPERLFYCVLADPQTAARAAWCGEHFLRQHHLDWTLLRTPRLHLSLHLVGDYKRLRGSHLYAARLAAAAVSASAFDVTLHAIGTLDNLARAAGGPYPLVLLAEGDGLLDLYRHLGAAMNRIGLRATEDVTHLRPHMTLSYGPLAVPIRPVEPIRFAVREFVLVHSALRLTRYHLLERWALKG